ncbi:3-oxoadipate enol-lactonase [Maricurvus nonylphenolicus]|uniref:alpha/beta fold hydrolase n=1 Tax=Maricurvus nonylphenolicus TaxID=1008307 RepID=UPI0036F3CB13
MNNKKQLIKAGNLSINYQLLGSAEKPVVTLAHSLATDMRMWEPQLAALTQHFRVLLIDARGHGNSDIPAIPYSMDELVDDVLAVWNALDIERSHFVGLSMGGMTGVGIALKAPQRLLSLVACDCRLDAPAFFQDMWDKRLIAVNSGGMDAVVDMTLQTWFTKDKIVNDPNLIGAVADMIAATPETGYLGCAMALKSLDYKRSLNNIKTPTLYLVGAQDGPHPEEMADNTKLTPNAQFAVIENAAHLSNMEQPTEFNTLVLNFLLNITPGQ